jgi:hypothetical protein
MNDIRSLDAKCYPSHLSLFYLFIQMPLSKNPILLTKEKARYCALRDGMRHTLWQKRYFFYSTITINTI